MLPSRGEVVGCIVAAMSACALGVFILGAGIALVKVSSDFVAKGIPQLGERIRSMIASSKGKISFNPYEVKTKLEIMFSSIRGHNREKKTIINMVLGWIETKNNSRLKNRTGGLVLYFVGPSGVGKTMAAEAVAKAVLDRNVKPTIISFSSVDAASNLTVAEQLFGTREVVANGNLKIRKDGPILNQIKHNATTVIIINEYDKLQNIDGSLDGCLWDIADNGQIGGHNCSNLIIIATSNESGSCVGLSDTNVDDGSETKVTHSKAFVNRIKPIVFDGLSQEEYHKILCDQIEMVKVDYVKKYNLKLNIDEQTIDRIVFDIFSANRGAREVNTYINNLYALLVDYRIKNGIVLRKKTGAVTITVDYLTDTRNFEIK